MSGRPGAMLKHRQLKAENALANQLAAKWVRKQNRIRRRMQWHHIQNTTWWGRAL